MKTPFLNRILIASLLFGSFILFGCNGPVWTTVEADFVKICGTMTQGAQPVEGATTITLKARSGVATQGCDFWGCGPNRYPSVDDSSESFFMGANPACVVFQVNKNTAGNGLIAGANKDGDVTVSGDSPIMITELSALFNGRTVGGKIVNHSIENKVLSLEVEFDYDNPSVLAGDIHAYLLKQLLNSRYRAI